MDMTQKAVIMYGLIIAGVPLVAYLIHALAVWLYHHLPVLQPDHPDSAMPTLPASAGSMMLYVLLYGSLLLLGIAVLRDWLVAPLQ